MCVFTRTRVHTYIDVSLHDGWAACLRDGLCQLDWAAPAHLAGNFYFYFFSLVSLEILPSTRPPASGRTRTMRMCAIIARVFPSPIDTFYFRPVRKTGTRDRAYIIVDNIIIIFIYYYRYIYKSFASLSSARCRSPPPAPADQSNAPPDTLASGTAGPARRGAAESPPRPRGRTPGAAQSPERIAAQRFRHAVAGPVCDAAPYKVGPNTFGYGRP